MARLIRWVKTWVAQRPSSHQLAREELEQLRRSIAMLQPGSMAMKREDAMQLLSDLGAVEERLERLRRGLRALLEDEPRT